MNNIKATKTLATLAFVAFLAFMAASEGESVSLDKPTPAGSSYALMAECEPTVEGEFPTAVVFSRANKGAVKSTNPVHIGKALDEEFAGKDWKNVHISGFCR